MGYNYKLIHRTQHYYEFQIDVRGKQEEWTFGDVSFIDQRFLN